MAARPALRALADRAGILAAYTTQDGRHVRRTTDRTREALLAAMGHDGATEAAARRTLAALDAVERDRLLPPVRTIAVTAQRGARIPVAVPWAGREPIAWAIECREEGGATHRREGRVRPARGRATVARLRLHLPPGYHRLSLTMERDGEVRCGEQALIVVPPRCPVPADRLGRRRAFGLCANLYAVRSARDWGVGDLGDLAALAAWAAEIGAAFVGVNPLHALRNRGHDVSPYNPVSRLWRNVAYLDVPTIPELAESPAAQALVASPAHQAALARLRAAEQIDWAGVVEAKLRVAHLLHATFVARHRATADARGRAYAAWVAREGQALTDFATHQALEQHLGARSGTGWRAWPAAYRHPRSPAVAAFRAEHAEAVDLHRWLQFECDRQLAAAARAGHALELGLYQDLAIGSARDGSDRWAFPDLFRDGASVGAPPDAYAAGGQDWGFPPVGPHALEASGYRYWIRLLRAGLRHAGALRIDHVMGLFRQFWIPAGRPASEGAYVRFPAEALLGILALESTRAGAIVVGEDLGTVPRGLPRVLARWGILSSRVLYFEQTRTGFRPAARYPPRALVTANTHDLPPIAGWWAGRDLELRRAAGLIASDRALARHRATRARERRALLRRLAAEGILPAAEAPASGAALRGAVHAFLCRTPSALVGVWMDDLAGAREGVNLPGVGPDRHPSWRLRLDRPLESLRTAPDVREALAGTRARVARRVRVA